MSGQLTKAEFEFLNQVLAMIEGHGNDIVNNSRSWKADDFFAGPETKKRVQIEKIRVIREKIEKLAS